MGITRVGKKWEAAGFVIVLLSMGGCIAGITSGNSFLLSSGGVIFLIGIIVFIVGRFR